MINFNCTFSLTLHSIVYSLIILWELNVMRRRFIKRNENKNVYFCNLKWKRNECNMKTALQQQFMTHKMYFFLHSMLFAIFGEFKGKKHEWVLLLSIDLYWCTTFAVLVFWRSRLWWDGWALGDGFHLI